MAMDDFLYSIIIMIIAVFIASVSQVMLKKSALQKHNTKLSEYFNTLVLGAYFLFVVTTLMSIFALKVLPLSMGVILDSSSYIFVTLLSRYFFGERINRQKIIGLLVIVGGIFTFFI